MQAITFYIILPFFWFLSILPMSILYKVSDLLRFLMEDVFKYRKKIIDENLKNSFPNKGQKEIDQIKADFYTYFCDLMVETIKFYTISEKELLKRCHFEDLTLLNKLYKEDKNIIMVLGHYGNWEWAGASLSLESPYKQCVVYHQLSHPYFDRLFYKMRSKYGTYMFPMNQAFKTIIKESRENKIAVSLLTDQSPIPETAYWTKFLNQDTPVFLGTEKIAKKLNMAVVFTTIQRVRRGKYLIKTRQLDYDPNDKEEGKITRMHTKALEEDILAHPSTWLWSHRRWKHKRKESLHKMV